MDPDIRHFLLVIVQSISMLMLWMLLNMTAGIYFNLAFFEGSPSIANIVYYVFLTGTFILLLLYLKKKWRGFKEIGES